MDNSELSAPIITIGVRLVPPTARLALRAAAPVVFITVVYQLRDYDLADLLVLNTPHLYLARGPPLTPPLAIAAMHACVDLIHAGFSLSRSQHACTAR